ncbi:hypothetical protein BJ166DRAFT_498207 [Pestalotiopsis sp. NC0098]|nr:hypothetical protein BJ166DRAFT_498207 [Pestalotiopsis sp. NC0098]
MCIRLTVQFLCSREDVHKCSGRAKNPDPQHSTGFQHSRVFQYTGIPQYPEGEPLLEDALAFEEDGIIPCGKVSCVVDQATFDALPREWLRCYKGRCNSCLMHAVRLEMTCDPEYEEWFCTKSEPSLRLREEHAGMLFKEFQSQQRVMFEKYLKFPLLVRTNSRASQIFHIITNNAKSFDNGPGPRSLHKDGILFRMRTWHGGLKGVRGREGETIVDHETGERRPRRAERW